VAPLARSCVFRDSIPGRAGRRRERSGKRKDRARTARCARIGYVNVGGDADAPADAVAREIERLALEEGLAPAGAAYRIGAAPEELVARWEREQRGAKRVSLAAAIDGRGRSSVEEARTRRLTVVAFWSLASATMMWYTRILRALCATR